MTTFDETLLTSVEMRNALRAIAHGRGLRGDEIDDAYQAVMLKAWRSREGFDGTPSDQRAWMSTIMRNHCKDLYATKGRWRMVAPDDLPEPSMPARQEDVLALLQVLERIPEASQPYLHAAALGSTWPEMAEEMGTDYNAVVRNLRASRASIAHLDHRRAA